jgi:hypothetical protein
MALEMPEYLPTNRTIRYRTDDPIQNLRIKIVMRYQEVGDDAYTQWITKERVFSWQEKVFGPSEFQKFREMASSDEKGRFLHRKKSHTPLEDRYCKAIDKVSGWTCGNRYIHVFNYACA